MLLSVDAIKSSIYSTVIRLRAQTRFLALSEVLQVVQQMVFGHG